jgi:predicted ATPase
LSPTERNGSSDDRSRPRVSIVGRDAELARLGHHLDVALGGQRQLVFVTGDPGIGKTTVVEAFVDGLAARGDFWVARGQCAELHGPAEAFMPVLEGFGRLCRGTAGERLVALLREHAPSWLVQLPGLIPATEREALDRQYADATRARMLREMVVGIEALTLHMPMVIVVEDLHWSDPSTFDLLTALAERRDAVRLLVIGTYRPVEVGATERALDAVRVLLDGRHPCAEVALEPLTESATEELLRVHFGPRALPAGFARAVHRRTGGNPLFLVHLASHGALDAGGNELGDIPASLRRTIEKQLGSLAAEERRVLDAASIAGVEFTAAEVAAAVEDDVDVVDTMCSGLARRQSLVRALGPGEWPDGSISGRYAFRHALYVEVLQGGIAERVRKRLHRRIGERLESGHGAHAAAIAAALAVHFARSDDHARALRYEREAGERAVERHAFAEASVHFRSALRAFGQLPESERHVIDELKMQVALGGALSQIQGFAAREVGIVYARALALCDEVGDVPERFVTVAGLEAYYSIRGDMLIATSLGRQMLRLGETSNDRTRLLEAHHAVGCNRMRAADFADSRAHLEAAIGIYDVERPLDAHRLSGHDPKVCCLGHLACVQWFSGHPAQARATATEAVACAERVMHPPTLALALTCVASLHGLRREPELLAEVAERALAVSGEYGLVFFSAIAAIQRGCALAALGDADDAAALLQAGLDGYGATGAGTNETAYRMLATDAYLRIGRLDDAERELAAAFAAMERHGERHVEAELERLKGDVVLRRNRGRADEAVACFRKALEVARRQQAKSFELRAATSLARLSRAASDDLRQVLGSFGEGFDAPDLVEAGVLLEVGTDAATATEPQAHR